MLEKYTTIGEMINEAYTPRVQGSTTVDDALELMEEYGVSVIGIECEGDFVGIFSKKDFEKKVIRWSLHPHETSLYEVVTLNPPYVSPSLSINETYNAMLGYQWEYMPVISGKTLLGIAQLTDLQAYIEETDFVALSTTATETTNPLYEEARLEEDLIPQHAANQRSYF